MGSRRSLSAGLPASTRSRIRPLVPVGQVELVAVGDLAALANDVGMGLEQAHQLVAGRHRLTRQDAPRALHDDALDQWPIVLDLGLPERSLASPDFSN